MNRFAPQSSSCSGRLALTTQSEPPQSFSAAFTLEGSPEAGELTLVSPIGTTLAVLTWHPGEALLRQGETVRRYDSLEQLAAEATGTPLPIAALFAWLRGEPEPVAGWEVELGRIAEGRLSARRSMPLPTAELRIVLGR